MDFYKGYYHKQMRHLLCLVGAWPYYEYGRGRFRRMAVFMYLTLNMMLQLLKMYSTDFDIDVVERIIPPLVINAAVFLKFTATWMNMSTLRNLLEWIKQDYEIITASHELEILHDSAEKSRLFGKFCAVIFRLILVTLIPMLLLPDVLDIVVPLNHSRPRYYLFDMEFFFNPDDYHILVVAYTVLCVHFVYWCSGSADSLFVTSVLHACGLCRVIGYGFENAVHTIESHDHRRSNKKCTCCRKFSRLIGLHKRLILFTDLINDSHTVGMGLLIFIAIISTTFVFFQVSPRTFLILELYRIFSALLIKHDNKQVFTYIMFLIGHLVECTVVFIPGQMLINHSCRLYDRICFGAWYTACRPVQKIYMLAIQSGAKPLMLYFGYHIPISFETLAAMVQLPISYFAILYSLYQEEEAK